MYKKFFFELFKEGIGYESGFFRTLIDLLKNPRIVVQVAAKNDYKYVNSVKFLVTICGYYLLVNSFFIDWDTVAINHYKEIKILLSGPQKLNDFEIFQAKIMAIAFSNGIIPLNIGLIIIQLFLISKKVKLDYAQFDYHKDVLFYYNGINLLITFIFSILAGLLSSKILFFVITGYGFIFLLGFRRFVELKPIGNYLTEEQVEMAKIYQSTQKKSIYLITLVFIVIIFSYYFLNGMQL